ncbi:MAG TPA: hypothetical protein VGR47_20230 [Terracidiphilus sp.]|nr:hypothetical protein [Terracidiphilus sp.]
MKQRQKQLQCSVRRIEYDFETRTGIVFMPDGNCVDMSGTLELFSAIDPNVCAVRTFAGSKLDTCYKRITDNQWTASLYSEG